jgi:hypothetical protein
MAMETTGVPELNWSERSVGDDIDFSRRSDMASCGDFF